MLGLDTQCLCNQRMVMNKALIFLLFIGETGSLFFVLIWGSLTIKRMLATGLPCTLASVPYGTHISVFASSLISTQSQSQQVLGGATEQDSDISQRMSSPTPTSEPEIIVELRLLTVDDDHI